MSCPVFSLPGQTGNHLSVILILLLTFLTIQPSSAVVRYREDNHNDNSEFCSTLYMEPNQQGLSFRLEDQDQSVNLFEDQRASDNGWNSTGSLTVQSGCKLKLCNDTYFDGQCSILEAGSYSGAGRVPSLIGSVACTCPKKCNCSDIHIKKASCGRAYLEGGCRTCHTPYTDLRENSSQSLTFPPGFSQKVEALRLRKGCVLTIFSDENFEGEETRIEQETVEDFKGTIGSYQCECNDRLYVPRVKPPRPTNYPPLVNISSDMNQVLSMLAQDQYKNHPGLNAARRSYRNKRSPKNVYVLLLGSTGAGKSSAINFLFDNPHITKVGDKISTTSSIHEFRIPVPIDELGIANSQLRVIDTPGMGDTRGLVQDAKYLATLDNYLATHSELKHRLPNVVLIFHKFHDNRFSGEGASFVKMIRGLDYFRKRITDEHYSNVVFVFSHFMSVSKPLQRRPEPRIRAFTEVIQEYTLFPRPTHVVVAENNAREQELPVVNGYYQLPNYDYYPRNLFEKLELITEKCGDPVGQGVFKTAFRDSENFSVKGTTHQLISSATNEVQWFLGLLTHANLNISNTEVSRHLQQVWDYQVSYELKREYPYSLAYLQKALNLRHINSLQDVPRTTATILELLTALKQDPATRSLLEKGLSIQAPVFSVNTVAGYGYHVFQDRPLTKSPFDLGTLRDSDIGFRLPAILTCSLDPGSKEIFRVFEDNPSYVQYRLQSLGIEGNIPVDRFTSVVQPGCNIATQAFRDNGCSISVTKDFRVFQLILNERPALSQEFQRAVVSLTPFNSSDHQSVEKWTQFFGDYGTHVVKSVYWGGSIQLSLESERPFNSEFAEGVFNLLKFFEDMTYDMEYGGNGGRNNQSLQISQKPEMYAKSTQFVGGDPIFHSTDLGKMGATEASQLLANWKKSLRLSPAMLPAEMRLQPINLVAKALGRNYTEEIERATKLLFNSDLTYKPPVSKKLQGAGLARDDTPVLVELMKMMREQSEKFQNMTLEMKRVEREHQQKLMKLEQDRMESEQEREASNRKWQEEQLEHARKLEEERRKHEREISEANRKWQEDQREISRKQEEDKRRHEQDLAEQNRKWQEELEENNRLNEEERRKHELDLAEVNRKLLVEQQENARKLEQERRKHEERLERLRQEHQQSIVRIQTNGQQKRDDDGERGIFGFIKKVVNLFG